jgi:hypothetical protein
MSVEEMIPDARWPFHGPNTTGIVAELNLIDSAEPITPCAHDQRSGGVRAALVRLSPVTPVKVMD